MTDTPKRRAYAAFIEYAAGRGQEPGTELGQLPEGYAPMPEGWRTQAQAAATVIRNGGPTASASSPQTSAGAPSPTTSSPPPVSAPSQAVTPPAPAAVSGDPTATGDLAGALTGSKTPVDPDIGMVSAIVPIAIVGGLLIAVLVPLLLRAITRRRATGP